MEFVHLDEPDRPECPECGATLEEKTHGRAVCLGCGKEFEEKRQTEPTLEKDR